MWMDAQIWVCLCVHLQACVNGSVFGCWRVYAYMHARWKALQGTSGWRQRQMCSFGIQEQEIGDIWIKRDRLNASAVWMNRCLIFEMGRQELYINKCMQSFLINSCNFVAKAKYEPVPFTISTLLWHLMTVVMAMVKVHCIASNWLNLWLRMRFDVIVNWICLQSLRASKN